MPDKICETCSRPMRANNLAICRHCEAELRRRLGNQTSHLNDLEIEYRKQVRKAETLRRGGFSFPTLYLAQASRLIGRQRRLLRRWLAEVLQRQGRKLPAGPHHARWCAHSSCATIRVMRNPDPSVAVMGGYLAANLSVLRRKVEAGQMLRDLRALDADVFTLIDLPANRTRVHVGPCPNTWPVDQDQTHLEHCPGQVDAYVPADETAPAYMRCDACGAEWPSRYWSEIGASIIARAEELEQQRTLARMVAKGVA